MREYGVTLCDDFDQLIDTATVFFHNRTKLPKGRRIAICAGSGGGGGWMADACDTLGLEVPELDPQTRASIDSVLPEYGSSRNPVDGTAQAIGDVGYAGLTQLAAVSPIVDASITVCSARATHHFENERERFREIGHGGTKPVTFWSYTWPTQETRGFFAASGVPLLTDLNNAAFAMRALADYGEARSMGTPRPVRCDLSPSQRGDDGGSAQAARTEYTAKRLLAAHGIGTAAGVLATDREAAIVAARQFDAPTALKIQSVEIQHKSEAGGIALSLTSDEQVGAAFDKLITQAQAFDPNAAIDGVLVEPMADDGVEVILGVQNDAVFGPMILVGLGGIFTELIDDTQLSPPVDDRDAALRLISRLKGAAVLNGARGRPPCDTEALADLIVSLSRFAVRFAAHIEEIDLNPVRVHVRGQGVSVVDALIVPTPARKPQT